MRLFYRLTALTILLIAFSVSAVGQTVHGRITQNINGKNEPLPMASVHWAGTTIGTAADADGAFNIGLVKGHDRLVAGYVGFVPDTVVVKSAEGFVEFALRPAELGTTVVTASRRGNYTSLDGILKDEMISFSGLTKMACCNLAESFENSASVTVGYSDAITGARQIKLLGLSGIYMQVLDETRPIMRGLGAMYNMEYTPGMWLESIQLSKGVTSVTSGHEAMTGQINLEYRKPTDESPLFINVYTDDELRSEANIAVTGKVNERLNSIFLGHASVNPLRIDHNGDGFMDSPLSRQVNIANRWLYVADNGIQLRAGAKYVGQHRQSGQMDFVPFSNRRVIDTSLPYGMETANENANAYVKLAVPLGRYVYNDETQQAERSNLAFILDYNYFDTDSYYGQLKEYRGRQHSLYFNGMYSWNITARHKLVSGVTAISDNYSEFLLDGKWAADVNNNNVLGVASNDGANIIRHENEAGVYAEYSYNYRDRFTAIAGIRGDYSNVHGFFYTPRAHIKWNIAPKLVLRGSAGLGSRSANVISDNLWVLATGRTLVVCNGDGQFLSQDNLALLNTLEKSFTYGGSLTWNFRLGNDSNSALSFDYFRTEFRSQVVADQERDDTNVWLYNPNGVSYTNTYQIDFNWTPLTNFDVLATFRYNDSAIGLSGIINDTCGNTDYVVDKPLLSKYKGLLNLQYATRFRRWVFDFTAQINGPARIPVQDGDLSSPSWSPAYPMFYAQVTRRLGIMTSIYLGCENIANFKQKDPIIYTDNVHYPSFNSSLIWGPIMGRKIYAGVRITF